MTGFKRVIVGGLVAAVVFTACISFVPFWAVFSRANVSAGALLALLGYISGAYVAGFGIVVLSYLFLRNYFVSVRAFHCPIHLFLVFSLTGLITANINDAFRQGVWMAIAIFAAFSAIFFWCIVKPGKFDRPDVSPLR